MNTEVREHISQLMDSLRNTRRDIRTLADSLVGAGIPSFDALLSELDESIGQGIRKVSDKAWDNYGTKV